MVVKWWWLSLSLIEVLIASQFLKIRVWLQNSLLLLYSFLSPLNFHCSLLLLLQNVSSDQVLIISMVTKWIDAKVLNKVLNISYIHKYFENLISDFEVAYNINILKCQAHFADTSYVADFLCYKSLSIQFGDSKSWFPISINKLETTSMMYQSFPRNHFHDVSKFSLKPPTFLCYVNIHIVSNFMKTLKWHNKKINWSI